MFIPDPTKSKTTTKQMRGKKKFVLRFSVTMNLTIKNYFISKVQKKLKPTDIVQVLFTQKLLSSSQKWDPGSGKTYPGSKTKRSKKRRILDPQHWPWVMVRIT
jgi:hypothetical protein